MDFDANLLLVSILVSSVGFVLFAFGKRMSRVPHLVVGLLLMIYPYFVSSLLWMLLVFVLLCGLLVLAKKLGY
jgi:hypothetical protein